MKGRLELRGIGTLTYLAQKSVSLKTLLVSEEVLISIFINVFSHYT